MCDFKMLKLAPNTIKFVFAIIILETNYIIF